MIKTTYQKSSISYSKTITSYKHYISLTHTKNRSSNCLQATKALTKWTEANMRKSAFIVLPRQEVVNSYNY